MGIKAIKKIDLFEADKQVAADRNAGVKKPYQVDELLVDNVLNSYDDYSSSLDSNSSPDYGKQLVMLQNYKTSQENTIKIIDSIMKEIETALLDDTVEDLRSRYESDLFCFQNDINMEISKVREMLLNGPVTESDYLIYNALDGRNVSDLADDELFQIMVNYDSDFSFFVKSRQNDINNTYQGYVDKVNSLTDERGQLLFSFNSIKELCDYVENNDIKKKKLQLKIFDVDKTIKLLPYQEMMSGEDYQNWQSSFDGLNQGYFDSHYGETRDTGMYYSWSDYCNDESTKDVSPVDFILGIQSTINNHSDFGSMGLLNSPSENGYGVDIGMLYRLIDSSSINPDLLKGYNYLYYTKGLDSANQYLSDIEEEINKTVAMKNVISWQENLTDGTDIGSSLDRTFNITGKGLVDGLEQFKNGVGAWFDSSRNKTVADYESMFVSMLLMPDDVKRSAGLIDMNGNSTSIIDFSRDYSGKLDISDNIYEISTSIGNMLPSMGLSIVNPILGTTAMGVSAGGNSYHQSIIEGKDRGTSILYGILSGASEALLEKALGTIPFIGNKDNAVKTLSQLLLAMPKEGIEEGVQEIFDIALNRALYGESVSFQEALERVGKSALYGAITSGIMNATGATVTKTGEIIFKNRDTNLKKLIAGVTDAIGVELTEGDVDTFINENVVFNSSESINSRIELLLDNVKNIDMDINSFYVEINKVHNMTDDMLPQGFSSVDEYKKVFVQALVESGKLAVMDHRGIALIASVDSTMLSEVLKTEVGIQKLESLFIKNIGKTELHDSLVPLFKNLDLESFNSFFSMPSVKEVIDSLSVEQFSSVIKHINTSFKTSWLENPILVGKICDMSCEEFYQFLKNTGYIGISRVLQAKNNLDLTYVNKLFQTIDEKFFTFETLIQNSDYFNIIKNILPAKISGDKYNELNLFLDNVRKTNEQYYRFICEKINNNNFSSSKIILRNGKDLSILVNDDAAYYNITCVLNGEELSFKLKNSDGILKLDFIIEDKDYSKSLIDGNLFIKSVEVNRKASNLVLTEKNGLKNGLNEVVLNVDGKQIATIFKKINNIDLNDKFPNAKNVEVLSVKSLGSYNMNVDDAGAIYSIKYLINGIEHEKFVTPGGLLFSERNLLDVDWIIQKYNLVGIEDINIQKVNHESVIRKFQSIFKNFSSASDIFKLGSYGGNQSDVLNLLSPERIKQLDLMLKEEKIVHNDMKDASIDTQKSFLLSSLVDKYYSDATDVQKTNLAKHYANSGCEYMAMSNAFLTYIDSLENGADIFKKRFGFDLYITDKNNNKSYNFEALAFDIYLSYFSKITNSNVDATLKVNDVGVGYLNFDGIIGNYFQQHGIELNSVAHLGETGKLENTLLVDILNNKNGFSILEANHFDLELLGNNVGSNFVENDAALANSKVEGKMRFDVGGHAMLVTDVDDVGNLIVSSWRKKFKFLIESVKKYGSDATAKIRTVSFAVKDEY